MNWNCAEPLLTRIRRLIERFSRTHGGGGRSLVFSWRWGSFEWEVVQRGVEKVFRENSGLEGRWGAVIG